MEAGAPFARASRAALGIVAWLAGGLLLSLVIAWLLSPGWVGLCSWFSSRTTPCAPIDTPRLLGYVVTTIGLLLMTIGPVVTTLWRLLRHGYDWETSRVEPSHVNGPIAFGIAYFIGGMLIIVAVV